MNNLKVNLQYTTLTTPLPDFIYEGIKEFSRDANGYQPQPKVLVEKLSQKYSLPGEMFYLTAGADEAIQMFALAFGKKAYVFTPTYIVYSEITDFYANVKTIDAFRENNYIIPTDKIPDATLIYLANPNNPFGYTQKESTLALIKNNPRSIIVVDEVYAEFADLSVIDHVRQYPNLAVLRSFSKSYGMAGNRIGFIVANPEIISKIRKKSQWANVSYLSVGAAVCALDHEDYFNKQREELIQRREDFSSFLRDNKFQVLPTNINAVLIKFAHEAEGTKFADYLVQNDFVISHGNGNSNIGLDQSFVRISIGSEEEMEKVKEVVLLFKS